MKTYLKLIIASLLLLNSVASYASAVNVSMPYPKVVSLINNQLQSCVAKNANLLLNGIKIESIPLDNDTVIHVIPYEFSGSQAGAMSYIIISNEKGHTQVSITDQSGGFLGVNLHLAQKISLWLNGSNYC